MPPPPILVIIAEYDPLREKDAKTLRKIGWEIEFLTVNAGFGPYQTSCRHVVNLREPQGVHVESMSQGDFRISYFALAKRYHPDRNPHGAELMANMNAARAAILTSYRKSRVDDG